MGETLEKFEALLEDIRSRIERLEERLRPEPSVLTFPAAAKRLGVGLTKLKQMVRAGDIRTSLVGKVKMIPLSEIHRVSTPEAEQPRVMAASRAKAWTPIQKKRAKKV